MTTLSDLESSVLEDISRLPAACAVAEVGPFLSRLVRKLWATDLESIELIGAGQMSPFVADRSEGAGGSYSLQLFAWPAHSSTQIHDHSCWGAICCTAGALAEERYARLDDGTEPNQAHIRKAWKRLWMPGEGVSTLLPYEGGIHRVSNPGDKMVLSLHIYGPVGRVDGRDYDPMHDYVCDRLVGD